MSCSSFLWVVLRLLAVDARIYQPQPRAAQQRGKAEPEAEKHSEA